MAEADTAVLREQHKKSEGQLIPRHCFFVEGKPYEEYHVDDSEAFVEYCDNHPMGGNLSVRFPAGAKPLLAMGQDESIYKAFQFPSGTWTCDGVQLIRPKTEGVGLMVSAFADRASGFGIPLDPTEIAEINRQRRRQHYSSSDAAMAVLSCTEKPQLPMDSDHETPGIRFLEYGVNRDGYWNNGNMMVQTEDVLDAAEVIYGPGSERVMEAQRRAPGCITVDWSEGFKIVLEMDWSSGHGRKKPDGLDANAMNEKFGGKQPRMHDTILAECDVGPHPAEVAVHLRQAGRKSTKKAASTVNLKLKAGETQSMVFQPDDAPPFYAPNTPKYDVLVGSAGKKRKKAAGSGSSAEGNGDDAASVETHGYVGKPKGLRQVLYERGWLKPGKKYTMKGVSVNSVVDQTSSLVTIMASQKDFANEKTQMQDLVESRGHVFDKTPKCHPEVSGMDLSKSPGFK